MTGAVPSTDAGSELRRLALVRALGLLDAEPDRVQGHLLQEAEEKLRLSEALYHCVVSSMSDGLMVLQSGDGRIIALNPVGARLLGLEQVATVDLFERDIGIPLLDADTLVALPTERLPWRQATGSGSGTFALRDPQGRPHWIELTCQPLTSAEGIPFAVVTTFRDITPLREVEQAQSERDTAQAGSRTKSEFVSRMSHEIRTPLNAVRGFAQILSQHPLIQANGDLSAHVQQILRGSGMLGDLVNDILDLQRIESEQFTLELHPMALQRVARSVVTMLAPMAQDTGVLLVLDVADDLIVLADERRLAQVLGNLVSNAIKYNRVAGRVTIRANAPDRSAFIQVDVDDTGHGMTPHQLGQLFQPFERLGKDTSQIEGTGLGLMIARSLIEAMHGSIHISSQIGHGTCVSVQLPRSLLLNLPLPVPASPATPVPAPAQPLHSTPCTAESPLRLLYVEDNRINALLFEEALRISDEFHLEVAEDGAEALALAQTHHPEVLVIDAHLPGMTGFDVLRALRRLPGLAKVPAYMCSADALPDDIDRALSEGFCGYWTKPIDILAVTDELHRLALLGHVNP